MEQEQFESGLGKGREIVRRLVLKKTGDHQLAENISQDIAVEAIKGKDSIRSSVEGYMVARTWNRVIDYRRKGRNERESRTDVEDINQIRDPNPDPEPSDALATKELATTAVDLIENQFLPTLSVRDRMIVTQYLLVPMSERSTGRLCNALSIARDFLYTRASRLKEQLLVMLS